LVELLQILLICEQTEIHCVIRFKKKRLAREEVINERRFHSRIEAVGRFASGE
jgi:hypothetical protein